MASGRPLSTPRLQSVAGKAFHFSDLIGGETRGDVVAAFLGLGKSLLFGKDEPHEGRQIVGRDGVAIAIQDT